MKFFNTMLAALMCCFIDESIAATRVMQGNSIMGGKDIIVAGKIYDVDFGFTATNGWVSPEFNYPGPASVFSTRDEASEALVSIYTQLIGNGAAKPSAYSLVSIGDYFGHPEQKRFSIVQLYGDTLGPNAVQAVFADFVTEVLFAPGPMMIGTQAKMSAIQDFRTTLIPNSRVEGYSFPVWTLKGEVPAVPEPSATILAAIGLFTVAVGAARRRGRAGSNSSESVR